MTRECTSRGVTYNVVEYPQGTTAGRWWNFVFTPMTSRGPEITRRSSRPLHEYHEGELRALLEAPSDLPAPGRGHRV